MAAGNFTSSILYVKDCLPSYYMNLQLCHHVLHHRSSIPRITCARLNLKNYKYLLGWQTHRNCTSRMSIKWKLTSSEHVNGMQEKARAQAQGKHVEASAWHAHTKGPCKPQMTAGTLFVLQLQDKQKRNAHATRGMACAPRGHFVEALGQKHPAWCLDLVPCVDSLIAATMSS